MVQAAIRLCRPRLILRTTGSSGRTTLHYSTIIRTFSRSLDLNKKKFYIYLNISYAFGFHFYFCTLYYYVRDFDNK